MIIVNVVSVNIPVIPVKLHQKPVNLVRVICLSETTILPVPVKTAIMIKKQPEFILVPYALKDSSSVQTKQQVPNVKETTEKTQQMAVSVKKDSMKMPIQNIVYYAHTPAIIVPPKLFVQVKNNN